MRVVAGELIGRRPELRTLQNALAEAARGGLRLGLVSGHPGIGKTALLRAFSDGARRTGARVLLCECVPEEAGRPFGVFFHLGGTFAEALAFLRDEQRALSPAPERARPFAAIAAALRALTSDRPVVLVYEDAHWADEQSLDLLPYLARRAKDVPLLVLVSYRTEEEAVPPLATAIHELRRHGAVEVDLPPLAPREVAALALAALGTDPSPELGAFLTEHSAGLPLFVEELLRGLVDKRILVRRGDTWRQEAPITGVPIPTSVRESVSARLAQMEPEIRRILAVAAVIGQALDFELLVDVADRPRSAVVEALRMGIAAQLLDEVADLSFAFRHALVRDAVLAELLGPERRDLHLAIAERIERRSGDRLGGAVHELAYHFDAAGAHERALRYHVAAAKRAYALGGRTRTLVHADRALALVGPADPDHAEMIRLYLNGGGDLARGLASTEQLLETARSTADPTGLGVALVFAGVIRAHAGDVEGGRAALREARERLEPLGPSHVLVDVYYALAREAMLALRSDEAVTLARRGLEIARLTGPAPHQAAAGETPTVVAGLQVTLGTALVNAGRLEGMGVLREAIDLGRRYADPQSVERGRHNLWELLIGTGAPESEVREIERELRDAFDSDTPGVGVPMLLMQALFFDAKWDEAIATVTGLPPGGPSVVAPVQLVQAFIRLAREGPARWRQVALDALARTVTLLPDQQEPWLAVEVMYLAGDPRAAVDVAVHVGPLQDAGRRWPLLDTAAIAALAAAIDLDDRPAAVEWLERCGRAERYEPATAEGRRAFARAEAARRDLRVAVALDEFARSAQAFERRGATLLARTLPRLRRAELLAKDDPATAQKELAQVMAMWRAVDAKWYLGRLREWAAAHGLRGWTVSARRGPRLTPRELEVARAVAEGLTNKEIGAALGIAERTAETHVQRILTKLDLRGRAQLAAWVSGGVPAGTAR